MAPRQNRQSTPIWVPCQQLELIALSGDNVCRTNPSNWGELTPPAALRRSESRTGLDRENGIRSLLLEETCDAPLVLARGLLRSAGGFGRRLQFLGLGLIFGEGLPDSFFLGD